MQLLSSAQIIHAAVEEACVWAEEFVICTPALDTDRGKWPLWRALRPHLGKLRHAYVAIDGLRSEPAALHELQATGSLRLVSAADGSFRANLLRFRNGPRARVLLGSGTLCPPGMMASIDAMVLWEGPAIDAFSLQVEALIARARTHGRVTERAELDEYAQTHFAGRDAWDRIHALGAPFMREASRDADVPELEMLEDCGAILEATTQVRQALVDRTTSTTKHAVGFHGGTVTPNVHWVAPLSLWAFFETLEKRSWNAFGVERPGGQGSLSITVEINVPFAGIDRKVGGAFARDPISGDVYLLHRGRIGGGQKGIGAELFWQRFRGGIRVREKGREEPARMVVVGKLGATEFLRDLAAFVHEVGRIKKAV